MPMEFVDHWEFIDGEPINDKTKLLDGINLDESINNGFDNVRVFNPNELTKK